MNKVDHPYSFFTNPLNEAREFEAGGNASELTIRLMQTGALLTSAVALPAIALIGLGKALYYASAGNGVEILSTIQTAVSSIGMHLAHLIPIAARICTTKKISDQADDFLHRLCGKMTKCWSFSCCIKANVAPPLQQNIAPLRAENIAPLAPPPAPAADHQRGPARALLSLNREYFQNHEDSAMRSSRRSQSFSSFSQPISPGGPPISHLHRHHRSASSRNLQEQKKNDEEQRSISNRNQPAVGASSSASPSSRRSVQINLKFGFFSQSHPGSLTPKKKG